MPRFTEVPDDMIVEVTKEVKLLCQIKGMDIELL